MTPAEVSTTLREVYDFVTKLKDKLPAADIVWAGGSVRDLLHGRQPKDFDLFWLGDGPIGQGDDLEGAVAGYVRVVEELTGDTGVQVHTTYRADSSLEFVLSFEAQGRRFDLICYGGMGTPREQVQHFDANINMVWVAQDEDGNPVLAVEPEAAEVFTRRRPILMTRYCDGDVQERLDYLCRKYPQYKEIECAVN